VVSAYVIFFGGFLATRKDVDAWAASATTQKPGVTFDSYAWPAGARESDDKTAVGAFTEAGSLKQVIGTIEQCTTDTVYLVGHSSGCAIAREVDRKLKDTSKVVLVALDGFAPFPGQLARPSTQVWAAVCGTAVSRNHNSLKNKLGGRLKIYTATDCKDWAALHFSVVNSAANDKAVTNIRTGYSNCRANLMWMDAKP
jgi:hypothetical protein